MVDQDVLRLLGDEHAELLSRSKMRPFGLRSPTALLLSRLRHPNILASGRCTGLSQYVTMVGTAVHASREPRLVLKERTKLSNLLERADLELWRQGLGSALGA